MSADIFISFASKDEKIAGTICTAIENRGFKCWVSTRNILPGENFQSAIVRAIRGAKIMLLVFTANSNRSDEMTKELALASQQKLMVVPLRVENVTPSDAFAYEFATRQWIDLFADWEQAMNNLSARLSAALDDDRTHVDTIVLGKATLPNLHAAGKWTTKRQRRVWIGTGVAAALGLLGVAGFALPHLFATPVQPTTKAADPSPVAEITATPAAVVVPVTPAAEVVAAVAAAPEVAAPAVPEVAPPPKPAAPKPAVAKPSKKASSNLPY
ncbi:MAG: toll/interleukin-1 receptor domain-containing protein [Pseudomonadota bacterium]